MYKYSKSTHFLWGFIICFDETTSFKGNTVTFTDGVKLIRGAESWHLCVFTALVYKLTEREGAKKKNVQDTGSPHISIMQ